MIQELLEGDDSTRYNQYMYYNQRGKLCASLLTRKIRQNPPRFGVGRVVQHIVENPTILDLSKRLLEGISYKGIADVNFMWDANTNLYKLIEVNVRLIGHNSLPLACGLNLPLIMFNDLTENSDSVFEGKAFEKYWINIYSDLICFIAKDWKETWSIKDYFKPYFSDNTFAVLSKSDPLPFLGLLINLPFKFFRMGIDRIWH